MGGGGSVGCATCTAGNGSGAGISGGAGNSAAGSSGIATGGGAGSSSGGLDGGTPTHVPFDAGPDTANMVQPGTICDRLATIQCAGEAHCCDAPGRTFDQCKASMKQGCTDMAMLDGMAMNKITGFDAAFAQTAFTTYEQMASMCDPGVAEWGAAYTGLPGILKGTVAAGKSCLPTGSLQDRSVIASALASCTNLAQQACQPRVQTVGGLSLPTSWTCDPKSAAGGLCFTDVNCTDGLYCNNPDLKVGNFKCAARKAAGTPCVNPNECASLFCKKGVCVEKGVQAAYCLQNN